MPSQATVVQRPFNFRKARAQYPNDPNIEENRAPFLFRISNLTLAEREKTKSRAITPMKGNLRKLCKEQLQMKMTSCANEARWMPWPGRQFQWTSDFGFWTLYTNCQTFIIYYEGSRYYAYLGPVEGRSKYPIACPSTEQSREVVRTNNGIDRYLKPLRDKENTNPHLTNHDGLPNEPRINPPVPSPNPAPLRSTRSQLKRKSPLGVALLATYPALKQQSNRLHTQMNNLKRKKPLIQNDDLNSPHKTCRTAQRSDTSSLTAAEARTTTSRQQQEVASSFESLGLGSVTSSQFDQIPYPDEPLSPD